MVAPLFRVTPLAWLAPDVALFEALLLTSANAPRHAGAGLRALNGLPCYCVGEATAAGAEGAGLTNVRVGPNDGNSLLELVAGDGVRRVLHLCGREHVPIEHPRIEIVRVPVYAAEAADRLPSNAREALAQGAVALLHSPRAARLFANLVDDAGLSRSALSVAAISEAAAAAAGQGWAAVAVASAPRDQPLLEVAAKLCNYGADGGTGKRE